MTVTDKVINNFKGLASGKRWKAILKVIIAVIIILAVAYCLFGVGSWAYSKLTCTYEGYTLSDNNDDMARHCALSPYHFAAHYAFMHANIGEVSGAEDNAILYQPVKVGASTMEYHIRFVIHMRSGGDNIVLCTVHEDTQSHYKTMTQFKLLN